MREDKKEAEIAAVLRRPTGLAKVIVTLMAAGFVMFHIYTGYAGPFPNLRQRAIHVCFALLLTFSLLPPLARKRKRVWENLFLAVDFALMCMTIFVCTYIVVRYNWIMEHPAESTGFQLILGVVALLLALEAGRRTIGILFPILTALFVLYALLGSHIPDIPLIGDYVAYWGHRGFGIKYIIQVMYLSDQGLWGFVTGISATIVAMFIIFGAFLLFTGGGETFIDLAVWSTGRFYGGAAKVATVASGFFGMISGSAVANVATTGNFTIPMMKKLKYGNAFAGGVEATASSGGQITPPIMGAGAFLMAEILEVPYLKIALSAAIPAYLFYTGVFSAIHFESIKNKLGRVPEDQIKPLREIIKPSRSLPLFIPIIVLLSLMLRGRTPETSAFWAIATGVVLYTFSTLKPAEIKERLIRQFSGMEDAGRSMIKVVPLLVCANIIISLINITGIGVKMSELIISISGNYRFLALVLAAVVTLILGMGVPTTAAYLLAASVIAPSLKEMGFVNIASHMFIFYYAILSAITPPVCAGVYVASGIARSDWLKTAWVALRLALITYILPFMFIFNNSLLFVGPVSKTIWSLAVATAGVVMLGAGTMGYLAGNLNPLLRICIIAGSFLCFSAHTEKAVAAFSIFALIYAYQKLRGRRIERMAWRQAKGAVLESLENPGAGGEDRPRPTGEESAD